MIITPGTKKSIMLWGNFNRSASAEILITTATGSQETLDSVRIGENFAAITIPEESTASGNLPLTAELVVNGRSVRTFTLEAAPSSSSGGGITLNTEGKNSTIMVTKGAGQTVEAGSFATDPSMFVKKPESVLDSAGVNLVDVDSYTLLKNGLYNLDMTIAIQGYTDLTEDLVMSYSFGFSNFDIPNGQYKVYSPGSFISHGTATVPLSVMTERAGQTISLNTLNSQGVNFLPPRLHALPAGAALVVNAWGLDANGYPQPLPEAITIQAFVTVTPLLTQ